MAQSCPACGGSQLRKASVIYESGTSFTLGGGLGLGGDGALGLIGGGRTRSVLAGRLAPPAEPSAAGAVFAAAASLALLIPAGGLLFTAHAYLGVILAAIAAAGLVGMRSAWHNFRAEQRHYVARLAAWQLAWVCLACGHLFSPAAGRACDCCGAGIPERDLPEAGATLRCPKCGALVRV